MATLLGNSGGAVLNLIILASAVVPLAIVGILCWIFWRAAHRKDEGETSYLGGGGLRSQKLGRRKPSSGGPRES